MLVSTRFTAAIRLWRWLTRVGVFEHKRMDMQRHADSKVRRGKLIFPLIIDWKKRSTPILNLSLNPPAVLMLDEVTITFITKTRQYWKYSKEAYLNPLKIVKVKKKPIPFMTCHGNQCYINADFWIKVIWRIFRLQLWKSVNCCATPLYWSHFLLRKTPSEAWKLCCKEYKLLISCKLLMSPALKGKRLKRLLGGIQAVSRYTSLTDILFPVERCPVFSSTRTEGHKYIYSNYCECWACLLCIYWHI